VPELIRRDLALGPAAGHEMAKGRPFAACYWDTPKGRVFSLRSSDDGADVSEVAKQYGGGGHRNASGFTVSFAQAQAFELLTHNAVAHREAACGRSGGAEC